VLAHQYVKQLQEPVRDAIFGNVGTMISFRIGVDDAHYLAKEFEPTFQETDLINLPQYHICIKLMIDGITSSPFSGITLPLPQISSSWKEKIITHSRDAYTKTRNVIEREILPKDKFETHDKSQQQRLFG
jgi:hypothetical protein